VEPIILEKPRLSRTRLAVPATYRKRLASQCGRIGDAKPQFGLNRKAILMVLFYRRLACELAGACFLSKRRRYRRISGDFIDA
jgi:hypothetical protein